MTSLSRRLVLAALVWVAGFAALRVGAVPAERCPRYTTAELARAADAAVGWIVRAQKPDGTYVYDYDRVKDEEVPGYNLVRHAGVTMSLYHALEWGTLSPARREEALRVADSGLEYMLANVVRHDDWAAFAPPGQDVKLGGTALFLASLEYRRQVTSDSRHDALMAAVGRFILGQQRGDGSFLAFWSPRTKAPIPDKTSLYSTGEALYALALLRNAFPDGGWEPPARRAARYVARDRDRREYGWWGPWADQWAAYALDQMAAWPLTGDDVAYFERLAGRFGLLLRGESQKREEGVQRLIRQRYARGGGFGTVVEGLGSLLLVARAEPRLAYLGGALDERFRCAVGMSISRQQTPAQAARYPNPDRVAGAWFREDRTRMDDQQHVLSGLVRAQAIADPAGSAVPGAALAGSGAEPWRRMGFPVALLIALSAFLAVNPARVLRSLPPERRRRQAVGVTVGGTAAAVLLLVLGPLALSALRVSVPNALVTVGGVIAVEGLFRVVRRTRAWPVAAPVAVVPAVVLLPAVWADSGARGAALAVVVGVAAAFTVASLASGESLDDRLLVRLMRVSAALSVAAGLWHVWEGLTRV